MNWTRIIKGLPNFKCSGKKELAAIECEAIPVQVLSQMNESPTETKK
jgi:hypothetical protein